MRGRIHLFNARRSIWLDIIYLLPAFLVVYYLWGHPTLSPVAYPLRLLSTFIHETGHSLVTILTGGEVLDFQVKADLSGLIVQMGGNPHLILPAGYLGTALFGSGLFYANNRLRSSRGLALGLGLMTLIFTALLFYHGSIAPQAWVGQGEQLAVWIGGCTGVALCLLARFGQNALIRWLLMVLAISLAMQSLLDLQLIASHPDHTYFEQSDVYRFAEMVSIFTPTVWAYLWITIAALFFVTSAYFSYRLGFNPPQAETKPHLLAKV